MMVIPTSIRLRNDTWGFKMMVPWVRIDGPGNLSSGETASNTKIVSDARNEGLGDVTLDATYSRIFADWFSDTTLKVKCPTADEDKGLGTGATDYEFRVDLARRWGGWTGFGHAGYRLRGSVPGEELRNSPSASLGMQKPVSARLIMGGYAEIRRAARARREPLQDAYLYLTTRLDTHWKWSNILSHGYSDSSAQWGAGSQISYQF